MNGYTGIEFEAFVSVVQVFVFGAYTSGRVTRSPDDWLYPDVASTRPSDNVVPVAYQRGNCIGASVLHDVVVELKALMTRVPKPPASDVPPITITRPSASIV